MYAFMLGYEKKLLGVVEVGLWSKWLIILEIDYTFDKKLSN